MTNNIQTVQKIYACFAQGDVPGILEHLDEQVQWEPWGETNTAQNGGVPWMQHRIGKDAVIGFFQLLATKLNITQFEVTNLMGGGHQVAAAFTITSTFLDTHKQYHDEAMHLWTFNEAGKVIQFRHYLDTAKHLEVIAA
ncbi:MAG: nuclear transport factor 2 family protein [Bacteroidetes bacterium]|nr:nuclear transport factor 2 family protein [Bacteroidota bacterium]